jgi:hypothetical protein
MNIQCPHCCAELELPDESVGWKVQCVYCNEKFIATEEFIRKQKEALKRKTIRIGPVKRKDEPRVIVVKRPSRTSPNAVTIARGDTPKKDICKNQAGAVVVDGVEVPPGMPFWYYIPAWVILLTFPLWIIPYLIYAMLRCLNPNYESMHDKMVRLGIEKDDDAWSYAERERWQWTLGTGRYADKD